MSNAMFDKAEIVTMYKTAKHKTEQIFILSQLDCCSIQDIVNILESAHIEIVKDQDYNKMLKLIKKEKRMADCKYHRVDREKLKQLMNEGKTDAEIIKILDVTPISFKKNKAKILSEAKDSTEVKTANKKSEKVPEMREAYIRAETIMSQIKGNDSDEIIQACKSLAIKIITDDINNRNIA